jgi:hypothetical protein
MTEEPTPATRQSQIHRGPRIVAVEPGNDWVGTVHAPDSNAILASLEGASAQEVMVRGTEAINWQLAGRLGSVENQDSIGSLIVIQASDGSFGADRRPVGEDGTALPG